ncbi:Kae1-associated serine/threonine protein kinase [Candidatus Woesearchaeota archaeon]|nr:Kae1-associated serine/threonine protein kinase [Candidatus Woesearchaeota archaeon]
MSQILSQGAEAIIKLDDGLVYKERIVKGYRHPQLDSQMRKSRTNREKKVMQKAIELGINVPNLHEDKEVDKYTIVIDFIDGRRLRDVLLEDVNKTDYLVQVGEWLAKLHSQTIMHGDLTTSNVLVDKNGVAYLIDFGLSFFSTKIEDMAVDIHLLEQAIESTHYKHAKEFFESFLQGYSTFEQYDDVMTRLEEVRLRGRNKH